MSLIPRAEPLVIRPMQVDSAVIFLHGLTTSGLHFENVARYFATLLPKTMFILPHAPVRPVQWAGGAVSGWYDLRSNNFLQNEDELGIQAAADYVQSLIDDLVEQGIESKRIILGGFSQGCAISLWAGTHYSQSLAGIFGLSGYLPLADLWQPNSANLHTPIFLAHGSDDALITLNQIQQGVEKLKVGRELQFQSYPLGHTISNSEIADLGQWLIQRLSFCKNLPK